MRGRPASMAVVSLVGLTLGTFAYVTIETVPVGLLEPMAADLHVSASAIGLLVTCYGFVVVVASIPLTRLTRRVPRRTLLMVLLAGYVLSALSTALTPTWSGALVARIVTALGQALFWSIVVPVAAGLFPAAVRGRVVAVVLSGSPIAAVVGVPLGTWMGQQWGWRTVFVALAVLGAVVLLVVATLPEQAETVSTATGTAPDARRFWLLVAVIAAATTGAFAFFTYVSPFVTDVAHLSSGSLGVVLLVRGVAGLVGVVVAGLLADPHPRLSVALPIGLQVAALAALFAWPGMTPVLVAGVAVSGFTFAAFTAPMASRAMTLAPGRVDMATSTVSTAVNVGITVGALLGSATLTVVDTRAVALLGAAFSGAALVMTLGDRPSRRRQNDPHERRDHPQQHCDRRDAARGALRQTADVPLQPPAADRVG